MASWQRIARRIRVPLGFGFAILFLWRANPTPQSIVIGTFLVVLGLVIRGLASGHVRKNEQLTTTGPYAYTRNPLYLGSILLATGFIIASRSGTVALVAVALFLAIYIPVIRSEEEFLRRAFPEFDEYSRNVPRLLPRIRPFRSIATSFSAHLYWQHREYNAALGAALMLGALVAKSIWFSR